MSSYTTFTLNELLERKGDAFVRAAISGFSCKHNAEVDAFLQRGAILSSRLKSSVTYLVFENGTGLCVGYFTLAIKPLSLPAALFPRRNGNGSSASPGWMRAARFTMSPRI